MLNPKYDTYTMLVIGAGLKHPCSCFRAGVCLFSGRPKVTCLQTNLAKLEIGKAVLPSPATEAATGCKMVSHRDDGMNVEPAAATQRHHSDAGLTRLDEVVWNVVQHVSHPHILVGGRTHVSD